MRLTSSLPAVISIYALAAASLASASVINTVQLSAASNGGQVTVTANSISFAPGLATLGSCPQNAGAPYNDGTTACDASVSGGNMMYGAASNILVATSYNAIMGDATLVPPNVQQPWIMIDTPGGTDVIEFTLQGFFAPVTDNGTNCSTAVTTAGKTCTPYATSPFTLQAISGGQGAAGLGTIVSLSAFGVVKDVTTGQISNFTGKLSQTLNDKAPQDVQAIFPNANAPGSITTGFTGSFTASTVPEPGSAFLGLGGLLLLVGAYRRKKA